MLYRYCSLCSSICAVHQQPAAIRRSMLCLVNQQRSREFRHIHSRGSYTMTRLFLQSAQSSGLTMLRSAFILLLSLLSTLCLADAAPAPDIRTGLVLSGGGGRGLAHIGVLERIEELDIQIHAIAGTSMGE